jgi:hypothetical protein
MRAASAAAADERLRLLGECLSGVAAVKALKAEGEIERRVMEARAREMRALRWIARLKALNYSLQVRDQQRQRTGALTLFCACSEWDRKRHDSAPEGAFGMPKT